MKYFITLITLLISFASVSVELSAQMLSIRDINTDEGLVQNEVYTAFQDSKGFMWFGTYGGLSRFDGSSFKNFTFANSNIPGSVIKSIQEDSKQNIWIAYNGGIARFSKGQFESWNQGLISSDVTAIQLNNQQNVWVATDKGISFFDGKLFHNYPLKDLEPYIFTPIALDQHQTVYLAAKSGLYRKKTSDDNFELIPDINFAVQGVLFHPELKKLFLFDEKRLFQYHENQLTLLAESPLEDNLINVAQGTDNSLILSSESEIWRWREERSTHYTSKMLNQASLSGTFEDREGNLWLTRWGGVSRIINKDILITQEGLPGKMITGMKQGPNGLLWISAEKGIAALNTGGQVVHSIPTTYVNGMTIYNNQLYAATDESILVFDLEGNKQDSVFPEEGFTGFLVDDQNRLWIGSYSGVWLYQNKNLKKIITKNEGLGSNNVWPMVQSDDGSIWVGTEQGLSRFYQNKWQHFNEKDGLPSSVIWSLYYHPFWGLLIGTEKGLVQFQDNMFIQDHFKAVGSLKKERTKLCTSSIDFIQADADNNLWVGNQKGLFRINQNKRIDIFLDKSTGLPTNSIYTAKGIDHPDYMFIPTFNGLARIDKKIKPLKQVVPELDITGIEINRKSAPMELLKQPLTNGLNSLTFQFKAVYMANPSAVRYRYYLEGLEKNWSTPLNVNRAVYTSLPFGNYRFHVVAEADRGRKSEAKSISFKIDAPFWLKWWFWIPCLLLFFGLLKFIFRYYKNRKLKEIREEREAIKVQNVFLEVQIEEATNQLKERNKVLREDLQTAASFQQATLPEIPSLHYMDIEIDYRPHDSGVSGDVYDFSVNREQDLGVFIGDATGHGIAAAFMSMMVQIGLDSLPGNMDSAGSLVRLNSMLTSRDLGRYITAVYLRTTPTGLLSVASAGHPPVVVIPADGNKPVLLEAEGLPLGMFAEIIVPYISKGYQLKKGDRIFLYTDGGYEWANQEEEQFEMERLIEALSKHRKLPLRQALDNLFKDIQDFAEGTECGDDYTVVALEYKGIPEKA